MPDREGPLVHRVQAPRLDSPMHRPVTQTELAQLHKRHHTVLRLRQRRNLQI
jgi:hypothetical protein